MIGNIAESFAVGGALLAPVGGNVDGIGSDGIMTFCGSAAVSHGIGFQETGARLIPLFSFDGDVVFEKESWFCRTATFAAVQISDGFESLVNGRGRNPKEFFKNLLWKKSVKLLVMTDPIRDCCFETFRADEVGGNPDFFECFEEIRMLVLRFWAGLFLGFLRRSGFQFRSQRTAYLRLKPRLVQTSSRI